MKAKGGGQMAEVHDRYGMILQNLLDAGCGGELTGRCMQFALERNYAKMLPLLSQPQKQTGFRGSKKRAPQEKYRQPQRRPRHIYCRRAAKRESVIDEEQQPRHRVQKRRDLRVEFSTDAKKQEAEHRERHEISGQINHRDIRDQTDK